MTIVDGTLLQPIIHCSFKLSLFSCRSYLPNYCLTCRTIVSVPIPVTLSVAQLYVTSHTPLRSSPCSASSEKISQRKVVLKTPHIQALLHQQLLARALADWHHRKLATHSHHHHLPHEGPVSGSARNVARSRLTDTDRSSMNPFSTPSEAPPAYTPGPAQSTNPPAPSNISAASDADPYAFLKSFDTVFLIDDSGSMAGSTLR